MRNNSYQPTESAPRDNLGYAAARRLAISEGVPREKVSTVTSYLRHCISERHALRNCDKLRKTMPRLFVSPVA